MVLENGVVELNLGQLLNISSFMVLTDKDHNIVWASKSILRRVQDALGQKITDIIESDELLKENSTISITQEAEKQHKLILKSKGVSTPLLGRWILLPRGGLILLSNPDISRKENMIMFAFDDFPENDLTIELLTTQEEHEESLNDARSAAKALREERDFAEILINTAKVIILVLDVEGRIVRFNTYLEDIAGYSLEEVRGRDWFDTFIPKEEHKKIRTLFHKAMKDSHTRRNVNPIITKNGDKRDIVWYDNTLKENDGTVKGLLAVGQDITDRRILENQLTQAQKLEAVGQLAAGIAHEINTPTQFVGDSVYFLKEAFEDLRKLIIKYKQLIDASKNGTESGTLIKKIREAESEADLEYLEEHVPRSFDRCTDGLTRISKIVGAMKEFAHPDQRKKSAADLNHALEATLTIARNEYKYVADVETEFGEIPLVPCYLGSLNQVFLNLFVNAAHAIGEVVDDSGEKGTIHVKTVLEEDNVRIEIEDTGCGIPLAIQERIFDPFFTTKEVGKGSGQGLSIARSIIVDKHSGSLTVESKEGKGTTFIIRIPVAERGAKPKEIVA